MRDVVMDMRAAMVDDPVVGMVMAVVAIVTGRGGRCAEGNAGEGDRDEGLEAVANDTHGASLKGDGENAGPSTDDRRFAWTGKSRYFRAGR